MTSIIKVNNLGKKYILNHQAKQQYKSIRDVLANKFKNIGRKQNQNSPQKEEFWALKDINFEIQQGDKVGIIGRNGAGKSTLLKILSRITEPTTGSIKINGRVASLLEVGTGFHPELTGRENIYLNGAILGMSRSEIKQKFDEIVDFAEVERFLDTPVKRYSSGMYMRLAFAVAAHLEPEILIVDEVLAVGDAQFQKKCLGKMGKIGSQGRTVIFVSHNMNAIEQLCTSAISLNAGTLLDKTEDVKSLVKKYLGQNNSIHNHEWVNNGEQFKNPWFSPISLSVVDSKGSLITSPLSNDHDFWVQIVAEVNEIDPALTMGYALYTDEGIPLYWSYQTDAIEEDWPKVKTGKTIWKSMIPRRYLNEGVYKVELIGGLHFRQWICEPGVNAPSIQFEISGGLSDSPFWNVRRPGVVAPVNHWTIK